MIPWSEITSDERWKGYSFDEKNQVRMKYLDMEFIPAAIKGGYDVDASLADFFEKTDVDVIGKSVVRDMVNKVDATRQEIKHWRTLMRADPGGVILDLSRKLQAVFHFEADDALLKKWGKDLGGTAAAVVTMFPELADELGTVTGKLANGERPVMDDAPTVKAMLTEPVKTMARVGAAFHPLMKYAMPGTFTEEFVKGNSAETKEASKKAWSEIIERPFSTTAMVVAPMMFGKRAITGTANAVNYIKGINKPPEGVFRASRIGEQAEPGTGFRKVELRFDAQEAAIKAKTKYGLEGLKKDLVHDIYDVSGNLKIALDKYGDAGIAAKVRHDLLLGTSNKAGMIYNDAYGKIFNNLNANEVKYLGRLRQGLRTVEIDVETGGKARSIQSQISQLQARYSENLGLIERAGKDINVLKKQAEPEYATAGQPRKNLEVHVNELQRAGIKLDKDISELKGELRLINKKIDEALETGEQSPELIARQKEMKQKGRTPQKLNEMQMKAAEIKGQIQHTKKQLTEKAEKESTAKERQQDRGQISRLKEANKQITKDLEYLREGLKTTKIKHPEGLESKPLITWISELENQIGKESFDKITLANDQYRMVMHDLLRRRFESGLIDSDLYTKLADYVDYNPRKFIQYLDDSATREFGGKPVTVTDSGLQILDEGSIQALVDDPILLLQETIARTEGRIARNNANLALYDLAEQGTDFLKLDPGGDAKVPAGWTRISAMRDGKKLNMLMRNDMAEEWLLYDASLNHRLAQTWRILSGSTILRPMATGINPEFAASNIFRDLAHIYQTAIDPRGKPVYSPLAPVAGVQIGLDIMSVLPDVLGRKGIYKDYIDKGGGMEFLTMQGRPFRATKLTREMQGVRNWLEYINMTSELITRTAIYKRMLKKGTNKENAAWTARNYLDFNQGGSLIKGLDAAFPYLNASVQGTRGLIRMAKTNPASFAARTMQLQALEAGLYMANIENNPEAWKDISNRDKEANFIITTGASRIDKEGRKRYTYIKIPKDQGQRIFTTLARVPFERMIEGKYPSREVLMAGMDFLPQMLESFPPSIAALAGYAANYNFYFQDKIWQGEDVLPAYEYKKDTPDIYKATGKLGLSPERTKYAASQFLTYNNIYKDIAGMGYNALTQNMTDKEKTTVSEKLHKMPFSRKYITETYPGSGAKDIINTYEKEENSRRKVIRDSLYDKLRGNDKDAAWTIWKEAKRDDKDWIKRRITTWERTKGIDFKWLDLADELPIVRARYFFDEWVVADEKQQRELMSDVRKIQGFTSSTFWRAFNKYKKDYETFNKEESNAKH